VDVAGGDLCPEAADVARHLAELLSSSGEDNAPNQPRDRASLSRVDGKLHIELSRRDGAPIAERDLGATGSCQDLAAAVAVIIATWEAELNPQGAPGLELPAAGPPTPTPPPRPIGATKLATAAEPLPPLPGPRPSFALRIGLLASVAGGNVAPGGKIEASMAAPGGRLGVSLGVAGATARSQSVGPAPGAARWTRMALSAGPQYRFGDPSVMLDVHLDGLIAMLQVQGTGVAAGTSDISPQFGGGAGVRAARSWGNAAPWVGVDLLLWPMHEYLVISGLREQGEIPRLEIQVAFGLSLGQFP
jgi:hypothetical protein